MIMDTNSLKQYLADAPPTVVQLEIAQHFNDLSEKEKLYAHHLSRLVWGFPRTCLLTEFPSRAFLIPGL